MENPTQDIRRWLRAILLDMVENPSESSNKALAIAITVLTDTAEPSILHETFSTWVEAWADLLEQHQNTHSSADQDSSDEDPKEFWAQP